MIVDLRDALADLATEAPPIDVADGAIVRSRARRRHHVLGALAVAAAVTATVPAVTSALSDRQPAPPAAPPPSGAAYEPNIGTGMWPWTTTQLPDRLDEPVLLALDGPSGGSVATVSGRLWSIGRETAPSIAPDGWTLASWDSDAQELVVRELANGTEQRLAAGRATEFGGIVIDSHVPLRWSPAGDALAVTGTGGEVSVVQVSTGEVTEIDTVRGFVAGWLDDERLLVVGRTQDITQELSEVTLGGVVTSRGTMQVLPPEADVVPTLSPDGSQLAWYEVDPEGSGASFQIWHLERGPWGGTGCDCIPTHAPTWLPDGQVLVVSNAPGPLVFGTLGEVEFDPMIAVSPRLDSPTGISLALDVAAAGPTGEPHTARWWPGWYVDWLTYAAIALLGLTSLVIMQRNRRRGVLRADVLDLG